MPRGADPGASLGPLLRKGTLGWRILSWFLALSLLPLLLTNTVGYVVSLRVLEGQVEEFLHELAEAQAVHVAHQVLLHELELEGFSTGHREFAALIRSAVDDLESGRPNGLAYSALVNTLRHELGQSAVFDEFLIVAPDGAWVLSTSDVLSQPDWFGPWVDGQTWIGPATSEAWEVGEHILPVLTVVHPVVDDRGLAGVHVGVVHFASQGRYMGIPAHLAKHVESYVVSATGNPLFVSHPHRPIDFGKPLETPLLRTPPGIVSVYDNYEGASVVATSASIPGMSWRYVAEVSQDSVFGEMRMLRLLSAVLGSLFALGLVAIVWLVARSLVSPVQELVAAAERLRARELGVQVQASGTDEIGQLGRTFNLMSSELERSAREIEELHDQDMRRASQFATMGELAAGIAHEFRNPVAGITCGVELLTQQSAGDSMASDTLAQMRLQLGQIETSVNDLLSYARPRKPDSVRIDPAQIVDQSLSLLATQAKSGGVTITRIVDSGVPHVIIDPTQMTHAVLNLSLNAIQAMPEGGEMTIHVGFDSQSVRIAIIDTGPGIPENKIQQIFRPFFTTKHRGSGLGLAITRGIVERNGGRLEVASRPGEGSTFTLVLPILDDEEDA
ncbi:MAG: HAMP domain-containing protein [Gemmatimonadales bacterium]|nr:MAG: HAMP domain-containing protein [Gemmatimonadales bacterium]